MSRAEEKFHKKDDCLSQCSVTMKTSHDHSSSYKRKHLIMSYLQFQRFCLSHCKEHGVMEVDMALEMFRVLHPDLQAVGRKK